MTYSIVGYDPEARSWGFAAASKWLAVGNGTPYAKAEVGAIATQADANVSYGLQGLEMLAKGMSAKEVLNALLSSDLGREKRQVGIIDKNGKVAIYTGSMCPPTAGGLEGKNCVIQGNTLSNEQVLTEMKAVFEEINGDHLAQRLYAALLAGEKAGGDRRGKQSACLLVAKAGYTALSDGFVDSDRFVDLRVDDHPEPVIELGRLLELHPKYL
jgi:uncharacterized Ntn-hydrolase superfamily protein